MDFHLPGASPSSSASSSDHHHFNPVSQNGHSSDPMHSWWESISKARSRIQLLSSLLPSDSDDPLSSLADTDRPARSLLLSSAVYSSVSTAISSPTSGSGDDPLCHWLYDTYLSGDPDLRIVVLSYVPLITFIYLHRIHHPTSDNLVSLSGFEAVLLALYSSETKARNGKPVTVSIPDLSQPSLYHSPRNPVKSSNSNSKSGKPLIGVLSPPLEPQIAVKSTKRACVVGVALDFYYQQISQMPSWSKVDFCKFATIWAGNDCSCTSEIDRKTECIVENNVRSENNNGFGSDITAEADEIENMAGRVKDIVIKDGSAAELDDKDARIPVTWELLQPILRILGHCLLGPLGVDEVKDAASVAVRRFYARASHELVPQAILATRSLIRLDKRAHEAATAAAVAAASNSTSSNVNTPSKAKKPELQDNNLTGPIPGLNQSSLKAFNVSHNNLSGSIPETETLQSFNLSSHASNPNLCGPPTQTFCSTRNNLSGESKSQNADSDNKSDSSSHFVAILVVADVIVLVVILFLFIIHYKKYKKLKKELKIKDPRKDEEHDSTIIAQSLEKRISEGNRGKLFFMENGVTRFELKDLLKASAEGLGRGNFGNCYKANLEIGEAVVVKKLRDMKPLSSEEFVRQVKAIVDQKHPNLLPLLAYYHSKDEKLFLYRFAANGNVYNRLHGGRGSRDRVPFRWSSRLAVARGVARVLEYLHQNTRSQTTVPHGNLKSTNVLLDENDEILVSDYGLTSLIALPIAAQRMVAYKCPEYLSHKRISKKSDIWSYGSLLLELLTGRVPAHCAAPGTDGADLSAWVHRAVREEWTAKIFDAEIAVQRGANQGMLKLMRIAIRCCNKTPEKRPDIGQVTAEVEEIKVAGDSDDEFSYSSLERSLTDDSFTVPPSQVSEEDRRENI